MVSTTGSVEIGSSIQFGNEDVTCNSDTAGTIRWSGTDFEGCDGTEWVSLSYNVPPDLYAIGDTGPAGGIVFYITDGGLHGLEAAPEDQSTGAAWGCNDVPILTPTAIGTGAQNTAMILARCDEAGIAAELVYEYTLNGYVDWFLPSKDELNEIYKQRIVVGGLADAYYWSSSYALSGKEAWSQGFGDGDQFDGAEKDTWYRVRAIREF